jgi:putative restriction endonuclease
MNNHSPEVIALANLIGRTPSSIAMKLANLASFDPSLKARGISGQTNASKLDREIWNEFYQNWDTLPFQSEKLRATIENTTVEKLNGIREEELPKEGKTREQIVKSRVNQSFFRAAVLASYNNTCCVTGMRIKELLIAGHIRPWGLDEKNRLNPRNGLAMNPLHDRAFELGLITITPELIVKVSTVITKNAVEAVADLMIRYEGSPIHRPTRFLPDPVFLSYHNAERFLT